MKIQAILTQQKCVVAMNGGASMLACLTQAKKIEMGDNVASVIILCHKDKVLSEFSMEKNMTSTWVKIELLYMTNYTSGV